MDHWCRVRHSAYQIWGSQVNRGRGKIEQKQQQQQQQQKKGRTKMGGEKNPPT
jgi:hypothetical protein